MRVTKIQTNFYNQNIANQNRSASNHGGGGGGGAYPKLKIMLLFRIITAMVPILVSANFLTRTEPFLI